MRRDRRGLDRSSRRMRRAAGAIMVLFAGLCVLGALEWMQRPSVLEEAMAWSNPSDVRCALNVDAPTGFEDEVLAVSDERELAVDESGKVVGFVRFEESKETLLSIASQLEDKGWVQVPSGWDERATFVKEDGVYRWLFVSCTPVGDATSVVIQYEMREKER